MNPAARAPRFRHALVTGKFYPPHNGHLHLIGMAADFSDHVTVALLGASRETIPIADRVAWLRADLSGRPHVRVQGILDDLPVDYGDDAIWKGHIALMREAVARADAGTAFPPLDAVFASESYGHELGARMGIAPIVLDPSRSAVPVSGTAVRADVAGRWEDLPAATRTGLCLRVAVMGAESTGTTTLARDLAAALRGRGGAWGRTLWVPEYGREYSAVLTAWARLRDPAAMPQDAEWTEADFLAIAREQTRREIDAAAAGGPCLILDTDALATTVWQERYGNGAAPALADFASRLPRRDLYILTLPEGVPFEQDGLRDGEHLRLRMTERFRAVVAASGAAWMEVAGDREARVASALARLDALAAAKWAFAAPIPERKTA